MVVQQQPVDSLEESGRDHVSERLRIGVSFRNLSCKGFITSARYQSTIGSYLVAIPQFFLSFFRSRRVQQVHILQDFEGLIRPGEMLLVLGRPGSGCSTFLKTLAGETHGFEISNKAEIDYEGIPFKQMHREFKGERVYLAELDVHFPELTVGQTLGFGSSTRHQRLQDIVAREMAGKLGLTDAFNTKIGSAMIRGISGGEKRRTSIAEALIGGAQLQCWDNSTRGLDSLTALGFVKTLRESTDSLQSTVAMSLYQASEGMYQTFDKVTLLYEGRQIYFGPIESAVEYFTSLGFVKPSTATTPDFLTSITNPVERIIQSGHDDRVPRLPEEFANVWRHSAIAESIRAEILAEKSSRDDHDVTYSDKLRLRTSTYPQKLWAQICVCTARAFQRMRNEPGATVGNVIANVILGIVVGSAFYNLDETVESLQQRAVLLFFALIVSSFATAYEITLLWVTRPIVEKHHQYAFYYPVAEGIASMISEFPTKIGMSIGYHLPIYFLANLRRTASGFFIHWFFAFANLLTMSMLFRLVGSLSRTLEQTIPFNAVMTLLCTIYIGFVVPPDYMKPWLSWFRRINPMAYTYESLVINEFRDRQFPCSTTAPDGPGYQQVGTSDKTCAFIGGVPGQQHVDGTEYIFLKYGYTTDHLWRNLGIVFSMMVILCGIYLVAVQYVPTRPSRGEVLFFKRHGLQHKVAVEDGETGVVASFSNTSHEVATTTATKRDSGQKPEIRRQGGVFHWESLNYEIKTQDGLRRILNDINGWVKPGTLTALMGITGAGKTALLDTLADRITTGTVSGDVYINGTFRDASFRRRMGYVQQEDIHLHTATVREALEFSALLRQPKTKSKTEKLAYVDEVLEMMEMKHYANAIVGVPGEGLNVEQRKRLTIAVEMAAKPDLLVFLDEPTSGLDSQTAWSICRLLRKLSDNGQSILCTIHQPSSQLFFMFDRLLLLNKGGTTLYFGDIGPGASTMVNYFESHGAPKYDSRANPAEWMLEVTGNIPATDDSDLQSRKLDWSEEWRLSEEKKGVLHELANLKARRHASPLASDEYQGEYAASIFQQLVLVSKRIFVEQWRDPVYTYSKISLCIGLALINGISFYKISYDIQGLTSIVFSNFLITQLFSCINLLVIPRFVNGRELFEARERHSKSYIWPVFVAANLLVEMVSQTLISVPVFASWYYPLGLYRSTDGVYSTSERGALSFLLVWLFNLWANSFSQVFGVGIQHAEMVVQAATLFFWLTLVFSGVLVAPDALPRFWIFLYRVSPLTYLIEGLATASLANVHISCSELETLSINLPRDSPYRTCGQYLQGYAELAGGYVVNPDDGSDCQYCPVSNANTVLESFGMDTEQPWRDVGILAAYVCFNILAVFGIYWLVRVPRKWKREGHDGK